MSGGAGFMKDSNNQLKANHKLGKIREKLSYSSGKNDPDYRSQADLKSIQESINHRFGRRKEMNKTVWVSLIGILILVIALLISFMKN
ncbi:MAG: hypothetical protein P8O16_13650 [Algoriphagus sp.]|uniref:hypothetical protein n=1 Tax=Algoriphagus sp. TaxID=1872435 RepID=UPI002613DC97|nr:hypothetical protein [Algoriphagus sp.]MDG1278323.1 hypothetical protein [Algoriphagus sp.]